MKKFSLFILIIFVSITLFNCGPGKAEAEKAAKMMTTEYETMQNKFGEQMAKVDSKEKYKELMDTRKKSFETLLEKIKKAKKCDALTLLHGKVLFDLQQVDPAMEQFESLIKNNSKLIDDAKFGKTTILVKKREYEEAIKLFSEIENKVKKDRSYTMVLMELAFSAPDVEKQEYYSKKFIENAANYEEFAGYTAYAYDNLAKIEKDKGNLQKGIEILEKALAEAKSDRAKKSLESALKQMKMLNTDAPEINAEQWVNSKALKLAALKGKPVVIDFWAPWCRPCRMVIPTLIKSHEQLKDKGLTVIGFTKLYGRYSDDVENKGKVEPEEESKLIKEFVKRNKISYPVAIANESTIFDAYGVSGIPTLVLIDKEGKIHEIEVGVGDQKKLTEKIEALLK